MHEGTDDGAGQRPDGPSGDRWSVAPPVVPIGAPTPSAPPVTAAPVTDPWTIPSVGASAPWTPPPAGPAPGWGTSPTALPGFPVGPPLQDDQPSPVVAAPERSTGRVVVVSALIGALVAGLLTAAGFVLLDDDAQVAGSTERPARQLSGEGLDIRTLLDRAQPSVVSVSTGQETTRGVFGGAGSGVVISDDGLVLTNAHVISGATTMEVTLSDGDVRTATLVGSSPDDDIALIRIDDPEGLVPAELGSSGEVQVGDDVVAIGNALNLGGPPSVTQGIVSAKDRTISAPGELVLRNLIQTDAAINPGNSGGPLVDADGRVVGINTAIIDDAQNIGFAIAIDPIKPLIDELAAGNGTITPDSAFLGVSMMDLEDVLESVRQEYGVTADAGAFVSDLVPGSAAADAGIELGDVIVSIDGAPVTSADEAAEIIRSHEPGDQIVIAYERDGDPAEAVAELRSRADGGG